LRAPDEKTHGKINMRYVNSYTAETRFMGPKLNLLEMTEGELKNALKQGKITVAVYGLGHVGLPLACAWLRAGAKVIGVAKTERTVNIINSGVNPLEDEPSITPIVREYVFKGFFKATTDGVKAMKLANLAVVAVPTKVKWDRTGKPLDLSALVEVTRTIGSGISKGKAVVIESTVPPGTTLNLVKPLLEETSGLRVEEDIGLAYSPERIMTGHALQDIEENYPKIVAGVGSRSTRVVKALYEVVAKKGVIALSSPTVAEFEKVAEGIYRDVNIALANELAKVAHKLGIDFEEVRKAANSQPYCHLHKPGTGVGGSCIPIYPYFLMHVALGLFTDLPLTRVARLINESMPEFVAHLAVSALKKLSVNPMEAKVVILGLAFRGGIADTRLSPTYDLINYLESYGISNIVIHDPYVKADPRLSKPLYGDLGEALRGAHAIIIATDHPEYFNLDLKWIKERTGRDAIAVVDPRHVINTDQVFQKGLVYVGVGRPWIIKV